MLHEHHPVSYFPQYDRLEQILDNWPKLFTSTPTATQPIHVEDTTVWVLSLSPQWTAFILEYEEELVAKLTALIDPDVGLVLERIRVEPSTPTAIYLARQIIVILYRLRDLGVRF